MMGIPLYFSVNCSKTIGGSGGVGGRAGPIFFPFLCSLWQILCQILVNAPSLGILDPPLVRSTCDMNIQCEMFSYQGSQLTELCHGYEEFVAEVSADNVCVDLVYYSRPLKPDKNTILFHLIVEVKRQIGTGT